MKKIISVMLAAALAALALVSCGTSGGDEDTTAGSGTNGGSDTTTAASETVSGTVTTNGSTSMEKVIGSLGEAFEALYDGVTVEYSATGSGSGIQAVIDGTCEIGLSSRALTDDEVAEGLTGTVIAYDAIAVIVDTSNTVTSLTLDEIASIFKGEITNWSELGGEDAEIVVIGREAGSGTRGGFEEIVGVEDECDYDQELTSTGDVITSVSTTPGAIGYASLASVSDSVTTVTVDGVYPSEDTVLDETYAIVRPFVFVTKTDATLSTVAETFFNWATTSEDAKTLISNAGAVPVS
ncbi:MAG: phosphate ABC transporter substrate-binding protein [Clostridiales bacterium]|nr:phosphate ABC transporter substrate-binding protein [Clostridiales bacterium]